MSRIQATFERLKRQSETAFIPFIALGDPSLQWTERIAEELERVGADMLELGIPYSDPLADGPVIQQAALRALLQGTKITDAFDTVVNLRRSGVTIPLILFTYVNPVLQFGIDRFFESARTAGADGVIIPDLPYEESEEARLAAAKFEVDLIPLVAPTSKQRIEKIVAEASGFVYCVSSLGVTGTRDQLPDELPAFVAEVKSATSLPVAVGFGVSTPDQASVIRTFADGVIVGSALVRKIAAMADAIAANDSDGTDRTFQDLLAFAASLKEPLRG
jgi:tryptophan synthase alpha chain